MKPILLLTLAAALFGAVSPSQSATPVPSSTPVRLQLQLDRGTVAADTLEKVIVKVALDAARRPDRGHRPRVNLALVIDRSGSMSGDKIARAREAALEAVRRLEPDDIVSLVAYDSTVETLVSAQRVGNGRHLEEAIRGLRAEGSTALHGGVVRGAQEVRRHLEDRRYVNRIILLSDGMANVGPQTPEELGRLGTQLVREGISVSTIGLGLGFNEDLMSRLARCSDGNTYFVENSDDLPRIFTAELGDVLDVVARRVAVEVRFPRGVRPLGFVGREGTISGQSATFTLNQLYAGQEKFALVEVELSPARAETEIEVASARLTFEDALDQRTREDSATQRVKFSSSRQAVIASADHVVQADYSANVLAQAKESIIALVDSDRRDEAAQLLREKSAQLRSIGETYGNAAVVASARAAAPEADRLEREGLDNAGRKVYRTESTQVQAQQSISR